MLPLWGIFPGVFLLCIPTGAPHIQKHLSASWRCPSCFVHNISHSRLDVVIYPGAVRLDDVRCCLAIFRQLSWRLGQEFYINSCLATAKSRAECPTKFLLYEAENTLLSVVPAFHVNNLRAQCPRTVRRIWIWTRGFGYRW